ncbi:MAG: adenylate/guanylate cyclase domain-containing protein [Actinomycetota bacterium]
MIQQPKTQFAKNGDVSIAYQVVGDGPLDLIIIPGFVSHVEMAWELPAARRMFERLASFSRLILFDKRGTGLSDPVQTVPTLEVRMDDARAVLDAVGSEHSALFGVSEGAAMAALFAATYPERTTALAMYGGMARSTWAEDYPYAVTAEAMMESTMELLGPYQDEGVTIEVFAPSLADDPAAREGWVRYQRYAVSPAMMGQFYAMFLDIDVRAVLPSIHVPTLVLHRRGDRAVNRRASVYMAERIPGARYVEFPGIDHALFAGDTDAVLDELEEFLTGVRRGVEIDRVLATVMFTDIVGSTQKAAELGDRSWRDLLEAQVGILRKELERFRGREVKQIGDGCMATFDGPARAIRCGLSMIEAVKSLGIEIRVGLHTGEVEVMGDDVGGIAVHIASRIDSLAESSRVFTSGTVKDLVAGSGITFEDKGTHVLKGVPDEWRVFAVQS